MIIEMFFLVTYNDILKKLIDFLCSQSAAYFHGLAADQKDSYNHSTTALKAAFYTQCNHEQGYIDFDCRILRLDEYHSFFNCNWWTFVQCHPAVHWVIPASVLAIILM